MPSTMLEGEGVAPFNVPFDLWKDPVDPFNDKHPRSFGAAEFALSRKLTQV